MQSILDIPIHAETEFPNRNSHAYRNKGGTQKHTYQDFMHTIRHFAEGFSSYGIESGDHVGFFVNNRFEWSVTDFALAAVGAVSVPRGSDTPPKEVQFIFNHSDSSHLIVETADQLKKLFNIFSEKDFDKCKNIFIVERGPIGFLPAPLKERCVFYDTVEKEGYEKYKENPKQFENRVIEINPDHLVTIVYTSGTTGNPKGVMLTHRNFIQNVVANSPRLAIDPKKNEKSVIMLPSWHVYERTFEYCALYAGATLFYSNAITFASDLAKERPDIIITVPRVWESIYQRLIKFISNMPGIKRSLLFSFIKINQMYLTSKTYIKGGYIRLKKRHILRKTGAWIFNLIRFILLFIPHLLAKLILKPFPARVGGNLRGAVCGAGALPKYLDELFNAVGISITNAYGMTECAPGILSRTFGRNTFGSTGTPFKNTEIRLIKEDGTHAAIGEKGVLYVHGPQVMKGYYKNPQATEAVLDNEGWLNTGDLAVQSENGEIIIVGREKDTIVLSGGENVEPEPIEDKMKESAYIDHAVLVGQDRKSLSAIIAINEEELMKLAQELKLKDVQIPTEGEHSIENDAVYEILKKEVSRLVSKESGFQPFEFIAKILPVKNDFSIGKELTQTLKIKRKYIEDKYNKLISNLMNDTKQSKDTTQKKKSKKNKKKDE